MISFFDVGLIMYVCVIDLDTGRADVYSYCLQEWVGEHAEPVSVCYIIRSLNVTNPKTTFYRLLRDPKPLVVGIAWVVECVERRTHVDETKFIIDLESVNVSSTNKVRFHLSLCVCHGDDTDNGNVGCVATTFDAAQANVITRYKPF